MGKPVIATAYSGNLDFMDDTNSLLVPFEHMGVGCASRAEVDRRCALARAQGCLWRGPTDYGPPVGYWAFLTDPDGHTLELSYGQEVGLTVAQAPSA